MSDFVIKNTNDFERWINGRQGKPLYSKNEDNALVVDHVATANVLCKFIQLMPMDSWCKRVMIMRVGYPLRKLKALSYMQIALSLGCTEDEVNQIEQEGKERLAAYLARISSKEFVDKVASERNLAQQIEEIQKHSDNIGGANPQS